MKGLGYALKAYYSFAILGNSLRKKSANALTCAGTPNKHATIYEMTH